MQYRPSQPRVVGKGRKGKETRLSRLGSTWGEQVLVTPRRLGTPLLMVFGRTLLCLRPARIWAPVLLEPILSEVFLTLAGVGSGRW